MNRRKVMKIVSILLTVLLMAFMVSTTVFAADATYDVSDYMQINQFGGKSTDTQTAGVFQGFVATLINLVQVVGMAVAIIMLIVMAIKYISAAPNEKAELKKSATIYVVGAIVLFAATGILQVVKNFASANISASDNGTNYNASSTSYVRMIDDETYFG